MKQFIFLQFMLLTWLSATTTVSSQQYPELSLLYGRGVHSYFANNMSQAEQQFTAVIDAGSTDPRVYYFRGMVWLRMGLQEEAQNDMRTGAILEARRPGDRVTIGKSLQRVQGSGRLMLEQFRREARLVRGSQRRQQSKLRYEQLRRREADVLRQQVDLPLEQLIEGPANNSARASAAENSTVEKDFTVKKEDSSQQSNPLIPQPDIAPADISPVVPGAVAADTPSPAMAAEESADPFGQPEPPSNTSDPFGADQPEASTAPAIEPADTPSPAMAAEESADPFGQPEPPSNTSDPFGADQPEASTAPAIEPADPPAAMAAEESADPFGQPEPASDTSDPFGVDQSEEDLRGSGTELDAPPLPEEVPTGESEDPFGQPETPSEESDPFGGALPSSPATGGMDETNEVDVFGEPIPPAKSESKVGKETVSQQGAVQKSETSSKTSKVATPKGKLAAEGKVAEGKAAEGKVAEGKAKEKQSTALAESASEKSDENSPEPSDSEESADGESDPFGEDEDDPFGGL